MTKWEKFLTTVSKEELICQYYKEKSRNGIYIGNHGIGCPKECPLRQFGGHCMRDIHSKKNKIEMFLNEEKE